MGDVLGRPFCGSSAVAAGLIGRWELSRGFVRLLPDVYARRGSVLGAVERAVAAGHWAKGKGVLVGWSAAALHGTRWLDPNQPAEIARGDCTRAPCGIILRQDVIPEVECCEIEGFRVTTPARTAFDLGRRLPRESALITLDALCAATGLAAQQVNELCDIHSGARGITKLRAVLPLVDSGAESPQETRTRLLLIDGGLPRPETQIVVRDNYGSFIARVDLGWKQWKVAVEYDGAQHWTDPKQHAKDIDRLADLAAQNWQIIRVSAHQLRTRPHTILTRVRRALHTQGAPLNH